MTDLWLLAAFFGFVLSAVGVTGYFLMTRKPVSGEETAATPVIAEPEGAGLGRMLVGLFQAVGEAMPGGKDEKNPLRATLVQAGYRLPSALPIFNGIKCAAAIVGGMLAFFVSAQNDANPLVALIATSGFGYLLPDQILARVARSRSARLRHALPGALDMLVLAIEAGQSVDQALLAACRGLKNTSPDLAAELAVLQLESRASNNRVQALRNFAARNKEPELKKFASLMIDTDRFGTGVGPALRDHAKYLRIRFRQRAQESARKVGVKLIFPVFFLIFPSVILVTLGPAVILIFQQMHSLLGD